LDFIAGVYEDTGIAHSDASNFKSFSNRLDEHITCCYILITVKVKHSQPLWEQSDMQSLMQR